MKLIKLTSDLIFDLDNKIYKCLKIKELKNYFKIQNSKLDISH